MELYFIRLLLMIKLDNSHVKGVIKILKVWERLGKKEFQVFSIHFCHQKNFLETQKRVILKKDVFYLNNLWEKYIKYLIWLILKSFQFSQDTITPKLLLLKLLKPFHNNQSTNYFHVSRMLYLKFRRRLL